MKTSDLRGKTQQQLSETLLELLKEQFNLRMQGAGGQVARHHQIKDVRKNIARVKTIMNEQRKAG